MPVRAPRRNSLKKQSVPAAPPPRGRGPQRPWLCCFEGDRAQWSRTRSLTLGLPLPPYLHHHSPHAPTALRLSCSHKGGFLPSPCLCPCFLELSPNNTMSSKAAWRLLPGEPNLSSCSALFLFYFKYIYLFGCVES